MALAHSMYDGNAFVATLNGPRMGNPEQLDILRHGTATWNQRRKENLDAEPNLLWDRPRLRHQGWPAPVSASGFRARYRARALRLGLVHFFSRRRNSDSRIADFQSAPAHAAMKPASSDAGKTSTTSVGQLEPRSYNNITLGRSSTHKKRGESVPFRNPRERFPMLCL